MGLSAKQLPWGSKRPFPPFLLALFPVGVFYPFGCT